MFYGGGYALLADQALGVVCVAGFVFLSTSLLWIIIKKTIGLRVSVKEEIEGLDIGEHGNQAYPEFTTRRFSYSSILKDINSTDESKEKSEVK